MNILKHAVRINLLVIALLYLGSCQSDNNSEYAVIKGIYTDDIDKKEVHLKKVEHGQTVTVATSDFSSDGKFGFIIDVEQPGLYVVNFVWKGGGRNIASDVNLNRFYLENGTHIQAEFSAKNYHLHQTNDKRNLLLSDWNNKVDTVLHFTHENILSITYEDFFPVLPDFVKMTETFRSNINSGEKEFDQLMHMLCELDMNNAALHFLRSPRKKRPKPVDYPEYYNVLANKRQPNSEDILSSPIAIDYLWNYSTFAVKNLKKRPIGDEYHRASLNVIPNDVLKGYFGLFHLKLRKAYNRRYLFYKDLIEPYLLNDYLKNEAKSHELSILNTAKGTPAFDFSAKDVNGKTHKLSDYKGKLVYVDVWATWCGPCVKEIPHLEKLQDKYKDKNITFMSVSIDSPKDLEKWKNYVSNHNLQGIQLVGDNGYGSEVTKKYNIKGIPRFLLIDADGNIVSANAPRPSDTKKVEQLIDESL